MIPFPSHKAPDLASWAQALMEEVRQVATAQGPSQVWSCARAALPPASAHPDSVVKIAETGEITVSTYDGTAWRWVSGARSGSPRRLPDPSSGFAIGNAENGQTLVKNTATNDTWNLQAQAAGKYDTAFSVVLVNYPVAGTTLSIAWPSGVTLWNLTSGAVVAGPSFGVICAAGRGARLNKLNDNFWANEPI